MVRNDGQKKFDLAQIALKCRNTTYNPQRFPAVFMRLQEPKGTAIIYSTGNITILGTKSEYESQMVAEKVLKIIKENLKLENVCRFENDKVKIKNIVATCNIEQRVNLDKLDDNHRSQAVYGDHFPGLIYTYLVKPQQQLQDQNTCVKKIIILIFTSGKMVFTGANNEEDVNQAQEYIYNAIQDLKKI